MLDFLETVFAGATVVCVVGFVLNRLAVIVYLGACVVHSMRHRDEIYRPRTSEKGDFTKFLNVWMVRAWVGALVSVCLLAITAALR